MNLSLFFLVRRLSYLLRNAFDIPRAQLLDVVTKLRRHLLQTTNNYDIQDEDALHSVPIKEMSNYDEYPRANAQIAPLREIDAQPVRQHVFGNPFKVNKVRNILPFENVKFCIFKPIDEIDEFVGSTAVPQATVRKRSQLEQTLTAGMNPMKKKRTRMYFYLKISLWFGNVLIL